MSCAYSLLAPDASRRFQRALYTHEVRTAVWRVAPGRPFDDSSHAIGQIFAAMYALREDFSVVRAHLPLADEDEERRQRAMIRFLASHTTQALEDLQEVDLFLEEATAHAAKASSARHELRTPAPPCCARSRADMRRSGPECERSRLAGGGASPGDAGEPRRVRVALAAQRGPHRHSASQHRCDAPARRMASKVGFRRLWHSLDTDV
jgi:hypothetical protein